MKTNDYEKAAEILKTLGHPVRLKIVEALMRNESCVKNIWTALDLPQATVSQHLALLKNKGILSSKRDGVSVCYTLTDKTVIKLLKVIQTNYS